MNRRTLLKGVTAGSIVPATYVAAGQFEDEESDGDGTDGGGGGGDDRVSVRFVDIPDAVRGGDLLELTVEIENPTAQAVRPTLEFFVDGERQLSLETTVEAGTTERTSAGGVRTEPVGTDAETTIRVETAGDSDARTVEILAVPDIDDDLHFPDRELTVRPGTEVHFEARAADPEDRQSTDWWVDGEWVGDSLGPWQGMFYGEQGADYWQEAFDEAGEHTVVAGIEVDGERYRASWQVTVDSDGLAEPTVVGATPEPGVLEVERGESLDLELEVADPNGNLDRVVWWLTQSDVLLDVSDVSGAEDTASITVDGFCHTCQIVAWVISADGPVATGAVWQFDVEGFGPIPDDDFDPDDEFDRDEPDADPETGGRPPQDADGGDPDTQPDPKGVDGTKSGRKNSGANKRPQNDRSSSSSDCPD